MRFRLRNGTQSAHRIGMREWNDKERQALRDLCAQGMHIERIANAMKRRQTEVAQKVVRLGLEVKLSRPRYC